MYWLQISPAMDVNKNIVLCEIACSLECVYRRERVESSHMSGLFVKITKCGLWFYLILMESYFVELKLPFSTSPKLLS